MDAIYSKMVKTGRRTYFMDVFEQKDGSKKVYITASQPSATDPRKFKRQTVQVECNVAYDFLEALSETISIATGGKHRFQKEVNDMERDFSDLLRACRMLYQEVLVHFEGSSLYEDYRNAGGEVDGGFTSQEYRDAIHAIGGILDKRGVPPFESERQVEVAMKDVSADVRRFLEDLPKEKREKARAKIIQCVESNTDDLLTAEAL